MNRCLLLAIFSLVACLTSCESGHLHVEKLAEPDYPVAARVHNIQGTVLVTVCFGVDGKVTEADAPIGPPLLAKAAADNARQWVFGPFPPKWEYPQCHSIDYVYRLEGGPSLGVLTPPKIKTDLPDRVEIIARPFRSDYAVHQRTPHDATIGP